MEERMRARTRKAAIVCLAILPATLVVSLIVRLMHLDITHTSFMGAIGIAVVGGITKIGSP